MNLASENVLVRQCLVLQDFWATGLDVNLAVTVMVSVGCCLLMDTIQGPGCGLWLIFLGLFRERARAQNC